MNKQELQLSDITGISLQSNDSLDVLKFIKASHSDLRATEYKVVSNSGFSCVPSIITSSVIKNLNPDGLFRSTVSAGTLMTYADGTISSIVKDGGKITSHAGFLAAGASVFAPIVIMQVLSMITGQYYMNGIAKQLEAINRQIYQIKKLFINKDIGEISGIYLHLKELMDKTSYSQVDLITISNLRTNIYKLQEQTLCNLSDAVVGAKQININAITEKAFLAEFIDNYRGSDGYMFANFLFVLNELLFMNKALEMQINAKLGDYVHFKSCYEDVKKYKMEEKYLNEIQKFYLTYSNILNKRVEIFSNRYKRSELVDTVSNFAREKKEVYTLFENANLNHLRIPIITEIDKPKETLLLINKEGKSLLVQECINP